MSSQNHSADTAVTDAIRAMAAELAALRVSSQSTIPLHHCTIAKFAAETGDSVDAITNLIDKGHVPYVTLRNGNKSKRYIDLLTYRREMAAKAGLPTDHIKA